MTHGYVAQKTAESIDALTRWPTVKNLMVGQNKWASLAIPHHFFSRPIQVGPITAPTAITP